MKVNTVLCVNLKTRLQNEVLMKPGKEYPGILRRDVANGDLGFDDTHFTFFEIALDKKMNSATKRNPHVLELRRINVNRKDDGTLYPTFNRPPYTKDFTFRDLCREAAEELLMVAGEFDKFGLVEEGNGK